MPIVCEEAISALGRGTLEYSLERALGVWEDGWIFKSDIWQVGSASVVMTVSIFGVESLRAVRSLSSFSFSTLQVAG